MNPFDPSLTYLVTGAAGFVGSFLCAKLLDAGARVIGFDNLSEYYDVSLKQARLEKLATRPSFIFQKGDLADREALFRLFETYRPQVAVHLAAQAGVRHSIDCPDAYISSNIVGFFHILEACRHNPVEHLVFASSSSVYGGNDKVPFCVSDRTDRPVSLYAATKKSNELMAYAYSKLYRIPATGLRLFTVYGPMGRPDMAYFSFTKKILAGEPIQVYNHGDMYRDFTYVDDIASGIQAVLCNPPAEDEKGTRYKLYNIGNHRPVRLLDFISVLERCLGREAKKEFLPMQPGDVYQTCADVGDLMRDFGFCPDTPLETGLAKFTEWYLDYYQA